MAIVPLQTRKRVYRPQAITLPEYAQFIEYNECAFFGVNPPQGQTDSCRKVWTLDQRNQITYYLSEAQEEIEDEIGYFLSPDWIVGDISQERDGLDRFVDQQTLRFAYDRGYKINPAYTTRWDKIITPGIRATSDIELGATVNTASDPHVVTVLTTVTDIDEIHVYHPDSDIEIHPSSITISLGVATIQIPRCRTVTLDKQDNPSTGWNYSDLTNFETTVDVKRVYTDTSTQAILKCKEDCDNCGAITKAGCIRVINERLGTIEVESSAVCGCCNGQNIGFYYYAGEINRSPRKQDIILRLTHSKMPEEPCSCQVASLMWKRDRNIPDVLTAERLNCPFGINDGAWIAWSWAKAIKHTHFGSM